ncbi:DegT/DnrJ/EryC1/StrS family aminotransferase [Azospirillum sp. TSA2s]|uniref:DegT/DnrJ/EryC1/StrS family aminotransferase n=1 Tax=Azospirillum sp. TSA2s TaxID=709810 RepID=UPI0035294DE0
MVSCLQHTLNPQPFTSPPEAGGGSELTVFRPRLPSADRLLPFLREIDANRWYSNNGPLLTRFEQALARQFAVPPDRVVVVANATAGLSLSLLAAGADAWDRTGLCLMASWTHEATAVAALRAGLTPWLHDVDEKTWQLDPTAVMDSLASSPSLASRAAHVVVTAPFGAVVEAAPWAAFAARTGLGVTIDAASGFDRLRGGPVDAVVSLHATKVLGIGEGGVVIARDALQAARIRELAQLGLTADRIIPQAGMNAKLSDYGAAIGLAALSEWPDRRAALVRRRDHYAARLAGLDGIRLWQPEGVSSTLMVRLPAGMATATATTLAKRGIPTRRWWHHGCHRQPAFATQPRGPLPVTEALVESVLGLPFYDDLDIPTIDRIVEALLSCSRR